jgi:hypothetical protein
MKNVIKKPKKSSKMQNLEGKVKSERKVEKT